MIINSQINPTYNTEVPPGLRALDGTVLPLTNVVAEGRLCNGLFQMSVEQHYRNTGHSNLETVYTFPLMPDAVLLGLELQIGERRLAGKAVPVSAARQDYEDALEDGNSAALLEKAADGLYTVSLGNLLAGETASIRYQYAQPICAKNGTLRITIPTTVAPRYGNAAIMLQPHQAPESDWAADYPFSLCVHIEGGSDHDAIESPTHAITLSTADDYTRVGFPGAHLDRDVVITIQQAGSACVYIAQTEAGCIAYAPVAATLPGLNEPLLPMSLRMVIDCSGSMAGESIKCARRGAMRVLESLTDTDEYSITRFGSSFEHFWPRLSRAVTGAKDQALHYLQGTDANLGGTEMAAALASVGQLAGASTRSDVLLVTDGEIWAIDELVAFAQRSQMRYFIVGVGFSPSHDNLLRLAEATGGAYVAVTPGEDIEQAMKELLVRIQQPRIGSSRLRWPSTCHWQTRLPQTLFEHGPVAVFAGLSAMPDAESAAVLSYSVGGADDGQRCLDGIENIDKISEINEPLSIKPWAGDPALLLRVATAMRIKEREANQQASPLLSVAEATRLAVEHNLVSRYTHYLVVLDRGDDEKPLDLPGVVSIKQMAAPLQVSECFDAPMFLRRQEAVKPSMREKTKTFVETIVSRFRVTDPLGNFASALNQRMGERSTGVVPTRIAVLVRLGLPDQLVSALHGLVHDGAEESEVVIALLLLLADAGQLATLNAANLKMVKEQAYRVTRERLSYLQSGLHDVVQQLT